MLNSPSKVLPCWAFSCYNDAICVLCAKYLIRCTVYFNFYSVSIIILRSFNVFSLIILLLLLSQNVTLNVINVTRVHL